DAVAQRKKKSKALVQSVLGNEEATNERLAAAAAEVKAKPAPAISYLLLDASELPSRLANLAGREGWWFVYRFELSAGKVKERLVHVVLLRDGDGFKPLSVTDGDAIAKLSGKECVGRSPAIIPVSAAQEAALEKAREEIVAQAIEGT